MEEAVLALVKVVKNRPAYFAERLHHAVKVALEIHILLLLCAGWAKKWRTLYTCEVVALF